MFGKSTIPRNTRGFANSLQANKAKDLGILFSVLILTCLVFIPSLSNDFVNWDDDVNLLNNPFVSGLTWQSIYEIFTTTILGNYNPLPILTFAIEQHFFGANPFIFHFNNLLLHLGSVALVYAIANRIGCTGFGAGIAAALFAIHPMHVESVAWVSQRKDVLFGLFLLAAIYSYLKYIENDRKGKGLIFIYLFFILSCFSKIQAVAFPLILIGLDFLMEKKWDWTLLKNKTRFLTISLIVGVGGLVSLNNFGSIDHSLFTFYERIAIGAYSFCIYIVKFIFPGKLAAVYAYPIEIPIYYYYSILPFLLFLYLMYWSVQSNKKRLFFVLWMFFVNIVFLLQFLGAGQAFLADRFSYIPYIGFAIGIGYVINITIEKFPKWQLSSYMLPGLIILFFSIKSFKQSKVWQNSNTLWTHAIEQQPDLHIGYHNRSLYFANLKENTKALSDINKAIALNGTNANYFNSRGKLYVEKGQPQLALKDYNQAISLSPDKPDFYNHRSVAFAMLGNFQEGLTDLDKVLNMDQKYSEAYLNRALIYAHTKQFDKALQDNLSYLEHFPDAQEIWVEAGMNARMIGKKADADQYLKRALSLNPHDPNAMEELALLK